MIEQYLSSTNEIATVLILPKILELNKALTVKSRVTKTGVIHRSRAVGEPSMTPEQVKVTPSVPNYKTF
jgi:hypothetical protein